MIPILIRESIWMIDSRDDKKVRIPVSTNFSVDCIVIYSCGLSLTFVIWNKQTKESLYYNINSYPGPGPIKMKLFSIKKLIKLFSKNYVCFVHTLNSYDSAKDIISKIKNSKLLQVLKV